MFITLSLAQKIQMNDQRIAALGKEVEKMEQETKELFEELDITPEVLEKFISNPDHFLPEDWDTIQTALIEQEQATTSRSRFIRDPKKTAQTYAERSAVQPQWLFIK